MELENKTGTYALVFLSAVEDTVRIGRLGRLDVQPGYYVYVGSAFGPGGVRARIGHHLRSGARPHWHVDYLKPHCTLAEIWVDYSGTRREARWAATLSGCRRSTIPLSGFGASDGAADSHLFYFRNRPAAGLLEPSRPAVFTLTDGR